MKSKLEKSFDAIREEFARVEGQRDEALSRVALWNKDTEIQRHIAEIAELHEEMNTGFHPSMEQWDAVRKWEESHKRRFHPSGPQKATARKHNPEAACFSYIFSYTHLGCIGTVECETCRRQAIEASNGDYLKYLKLITERDCSFSIGEV